MQWVILKIALQTNQPLSEIANMTDQQLLAVLEILGG